MNPLIEKAALKPYNLTHGEIVSLLSLEDTDELFSAAYQLKCRYVGKTVSMRGIIERATSARRTVITAGSGAAIRT